MLSGHTCLAARLHNSHEYLNVYQHMDSWVGTELANAYSNSCRNLQCDRSEPWPKMQHVRQNCATGTPQPNAHNIVEKEWPHRPPDDQVATFPWMRLQTPIFNKPAARYPRITRGSNDPTPQESIQLGGTSPTLITVLGTTNAAQHDTRHDELAARERVTWTGDYPLMSRTHCSGSTKELHKCYPRIWSSTVSTRTDTTSSGSSQSFRPKTAVPHSTRTFARESGILLPGRVQWSATLFLNGKGANVIREVDIVSQR
jgi:hypothetical protein